MTTKEQSQIVEETLRDYEAGEISIGRVGEILGLHIMDVQHLLAEHNIPLTLEVEDWKKEQANLKKLGYLE